MSIEAVRYSPMPLRLETERLILRPWADSDAEAYRALIRERGEGTPSLETVREKIAAQHAQANDAGIALLAVRHRDDNGFVGYCGLTVGRASVDEPELAFEVLRQEQGQGQATEAAGAVLAAATATGRERLWATIRAWNAPSFRVAQKLGFHRDHSSFDEGGEVVWMTRRLTLHDAS